MNKIITIGNATLDIALKSSGFKTKNKSLNFNIGSKFYIDDAHFNLGGGAINSTITFAKLGIETDIYFKIGKDLIGGIINAMLQGQVIELQSKQESGRIKICPRIFESPSSFSVILLPQKADRIILAYHSKNYHKWELKEFPQGIKDSFIFINTDETFAKTWKIYLKKLKADGNFIAINPSKPFLQENKQDTTTILNLADIVILNKEEACLFLSSKITDEKKLIKLFRTALPKPKILTMTIGEKGVLVMQGKNLYRTSGFKAEKIADGTGAGDAFGSAFCGYLVKRGFTRTNGWINADKSEIDSVIKEAIRKGCANAVSVIEKVGGQTGILTEKDYSQKRFLNIKITNIS